MAAAFRSTLAETYAPATANKIISAIRGVLKEAWRLGLMTAEDMHRACDIPAIKSTTLPKGRALADTEVSALFEACAKDESPAGRRDAAMLAVLYGSGLRRAEIVALDINDYNSESGQLLIRGKGAKERTGYTAHSNKTLLEAWLAVRGDTSDPLFVPIDKAGHASPRRLTDHAVWQVLGKRAKEAGVTNVSPHDMRRSFCTSLLDHGVDLSTAQRLLGHASPTTTGRYDRRGEAAKMAAVALLSAPVEVRQ